MFGLALSNTRYDALKGGLFLYNPEEVVFEQILAQYPEPTV